MMSIKYEYVIWGVDTSEYNVRSIRSKLHGASEELMSLVLNFRLYNELKISMSSNRFSGSGTSYTYAKQALDTLIAKGYLILSRDYGTAIKEARTYQRTPKFEQTFRMRVKDKLLVKEKVLSGSSSIKVPGLKTYSELVKTVELSISNGFQVYRHVRLNQGESKNGIFAEGTYNYQNGIHKEERKLLLINGQPTVELDFPSLHPNLLLNREGQPCETQFYERLLTALDLPYSKTKRDALKRLVLPIFNTDSFASFSGAAYDMRDEHTGERLLDILGVKPRQIYDATLMVYPALKPYICCYTELWTLLLPEQTKLMVGILEQLAGEGIVGLPEHDSVIVQKQHRERLKQVMEQVYREQTGFDIQVKE